MTRPLRCREAVERLWTYLDGDLDAIDHEEVEAHLSFCLRCCGELAFAREVRARLAASQVPVPDDVHDRLAAFIDDLGAPGTPAQGSPT
jgi:anti-sigma factor RsiW